VNRQKGSEIGFGNSHWPVEAVRDEYPLLDPAPNRALTHPHTLGDFFDREEFRGRFGRVAFHSCPPVHLFRDVA
jgi:hypothetical protein